jgi:hypothetical protein
MVSKFLNSRYLKSALIFLILCNLSIPSYAQIKEERNFVWPNNNSIASEFCLSENGMEFSGLPGDPIVASEAGKVIYAQRMLNYGYYVILDHGHDLTSVYWHDKRLKIIVKEGQVVKRGQIISEMDSADSKRAKFYFDIRHLGNTVNPLDYLQARGKKRDLKLTHGMTDDEIIRAFDKMSCKEQKKIDLKPIPKILIGKYYRGTIKECTDSDAGFESRLTINKYEIQFGSIAHCESLGAKVNLNTFRIKVRCYSEEGNSNESTMILNLIPEGLRHRDQLLKRCPVE